MECNIDSETKDVKKINVRKAVILPAVLLCALIAIIFYVKFIWAFVPLVSAWALTCSVPVAGFLLSLAHWFFVRLYKSPKSFSNCSMLVTIGIILCGYIYAELRCGIIRSFIRRWSLGLDTVLFDTVFFSAELIFTIAFSIFSKILSGKYAARREKEQGIQTEYNVDSAPKRISIRKAAILLFILLLASAAMIFGGVIMERHTSLEWPDGFWTFNLIVPTIGFFISMINWFFVRLYKSRKSFSNSSLLILIGSTLCGYILTAIHDGLNLFELLSGILSFLSFDFIMGLFGMFGMFGLLFGLGFVFAIFFGVLSKLLSDKYAAMLGKE